jgi:hypothetical protein
MVWCRCLEGWGSPPLLPLRVLSRSEPGGRSTDPCRLSLTYESKKTVSEALLTLTFETGERVFWAQVRRYSRVHRAESFSMLTFQVGAPLRRKPLSRPGFPWANPNTADAPISGAGLLSAGTTPIRWGSTPLQGISRTVAKRPFRRMGAAVLANQQG